MEEKGLGRRIQNARKAAGLTQQQLCHKAKLSYSTLAKIERGAIRSPSVFTIRSIAEAINISVNELMDGGQPHKIEYTKKKSVGGISFVYFDVNGCLVRFFQRAFTKLAEYTGQPADLIETAFWHFNDEVCLGHMSLDEFNEKLAKTLGAENINWAEIYLDAVDPVPGMIEFVNWVAENYRVGLLTNIMPGFINELINKRLIPDIKYDSIIDSSAVGAIKPQADIYKIAQKEAKVRPEEILLVDDSRTNLMAAEKFGWHVVWFDNFHSEESINKLKSALEFQSVQPANQTEPEAESPIIDLRGSFLSFTQSPKISDIPTEYS